LRIDGHKVVSNDCDHGESSKAVGQSVQGIMCDHSAFWMMWKLVKVRLAGQLTRDSGVEGGKPRTRHSLLRSTIIPPSQSFRLYSPFNLEYPPKMRPTAAVRGDAPTGKAYSLWWGAKEGAIRQKGIIQYTVSPFRQRAAKNLFRGYLFNGYRRLSSQVGYWIVPVVIGYSTYAWAKKYDAYLNSKEGHIAQAGEH